MKWIRLVVIVFIVLAIPLISSPASADTSSDVVVTAVGYIAGIPGDFTVTYVNDYEVGLSWTKGTDAVNTLIRASYNGTPTSITEGYLVYFGPDEYITDTTMNFDEYLGKIYYSAWSEDGAGHYTPNYAEGNVEGVSVILLFIGAFGGLFLVLGFIFRQMALAFFAGFIFLGLSISGWANTVVMYDVQWLIGFIGIIALLICFVMGFIIQYRASTEKYVSRRREAKEFPTERSLTEEEAYAQQLDGEIGQAKKRQTRAKARKIIDRYSE